MQCSVLIPVRQHVLCPVSTLIGGWAHDITSLQIRWMCMLLGVVSWFTSAKLSLTRFCTAFCRLYIWIAHFSPLSRLWLMCRMKFPALITSYALIWLYAWKSSSVSVVMLLDTPRFGQ